MTFTATQLQQVLDDHMQEGLYLEFKRLLGFRTLQ